MALDFQYIYVPVHNSQIAFTILYMCKPGLNYCKFGVINFSPYLDYIMSDKIQDIILILSSYDQNRVINYACFRQ